MSTKISSTMNSLKSNLQRQRETMDLEIPKNAKIFFQTWGKYYHRGKADLQTEKFFQNNQFFAQRVPIEEVNKGDKFGPMIIPDKSSFFIVLYKDKVVIYSKRHDLYSSSVDTLMITDMKPIPEDKFLKGSVVNIEKMKSHPEAGHCLAVKTKWETWTFCMNSLEHKSKFLKTLIKLKIVNQRDHNQIITQATMKEEDKLSQSDLDPEAAENEGRKPEDGKMVLLQNWSECTLKCGGGKSFQQWMCIPPKGNGKPCSGDLLRSKPCNEDPCPSTEKAEAKVKDEMPKFKAPVVKIERFSNRYNRYSKCIIKETDIFRFDENQNKLPARIVMNNQTITIYGDDSYTNLVHSFILEHTTFKIIKQEHCCFELEDSGVKSKFCGFDSYCGPIDKNIFPDQWKDDFLLFKDTCKTGKQTLLLTKEDEKEIEKAKNKKIANQVVEVEGEKLETVRDEIQTEKGRKVLKRVEKTEKAGYKVAEKELMIENLIKLDEEQKEKEKEVALMNEIDQEKQKANSFEMQIKEKELDEDFKEDDYQAESDITEMKKEIKDQVELNRMSLKREIKKIKDESKQRRSKLRAKLKLVKQRLAKKLLNSVKKGDIARCKKGRTDSTERDTYCNTVIPDDFVENESCKQKDNFCFTCCDKEFGTLLVNERDNCLTMCDEEENREEKEKREKERKQRAETAEKSQWKWLKKQGVTVSLE